MTKSVNEMTIQEAQKALDDAVAASFEWKHGHDQRSFSAYEAELRQFLIKAGFDETRVLKIKRVFIGLIQCVQIEVMGPNNQVLTPN